MNVRKIVGSVALITLIVALNLLIWIQDPFTLWVMIPMGAAVLLGVAWLVMVVLSLADKATLEGRTIGGINAVVSSLIFLAICIVIFAFMQAWDVSWDLTQEGRRELAPQTVQVLQTMDQEVAVTCFFLKVDQELVLIAKEKTQRFLEQCQEHTDMLKVEFLDPQIDKVRLQSMIESNTHVSAQGTVVISAGNRKKVIMLSGGSPRLEERDFTNALINVLRGLDPKIYALTGHKERDMNSEDAQNGGSMLRNLLMGQSFQLEPFSITLALPEIPQDCDLLILNNPQADLHPQEILALDEYLQQGGRLLVLVDPWISVTPGSLSGEALRPWLLNRFGIEVGSDILMSDARERRYELELSPEAAPFLDTDHGFGIYRGHYHAEHPVTQGFDQRMLMQAVRTVILAKDLPEGVAAATLLRSTTDYWGETDLTKLAETGQGKQDEGEATGPLTIAAAATLLSERIDEETGRPYVGRIVVMGNSSFASNSYLNVPGNLNFIMNAVEWLTGHEELISIRPRSKDDPPLILSKTQERAVAWVSTMLTLQAVLLAGLAVYVLRRKNQ